MTKDTQHRIDGKQRVQILTLYGAARRVAARHFNDYDADIAAMYWTGLHVSAVLKLPSPLIRLAVVLEREPYALVSSIGAYPVLKAREPVTCERAYPEFLGLYDDMVILPEINRLENWTSPALIIDGDENEEIEIYRAADPGDPQTGRERRACA